MSTIDLSNIKLRRFDFELSYLSEFAAKSSDILPRDREEAECPIRTAFQRDRDRILHSKAFRRPKHKTQVFFSPENDHYRTRMTHTLEVSQISRTIARSLLMNEDLTEAIALGHDLGHTPFGHTGEYVLNSLLKEGFKHNEQSLRVVTKLENLNLTQEVKNGILNHTGEEKPFTVEGQIVKISDRIAYLNHDIDDAIRAGIIKISDLPEKAISYFGATRSERITKMVTNIITNSFGKNEICLDEECMSHMNDLRTWMFDNIYLNADVRPEERKAKKMIKELFEYYCENIEKLVDTSHNAAKAIERTAVDYIAGMTDRFAINKYKECFIPVPIPIQNEHENILKLAELNGLNRK